MVNINNMEINRTIHYKLDNLNDIQKIKFCIFCAERIVDHYKDFDLVVKNENLEELIKGQDGYSTLREILDYAKIDLVDNKGENSRINEYINLCAKLMPDYDEYGGDYETIVAQYIPRTIGFIFEFYNRREDRFVYWCSDNNIEILNAICSYQYRSKNICIDNNERRNYVIGHYLQEIQIESQFIDMLREGAELSDLIEFTRNNIISIDHLS